MIYSEAAYFDGNHCQHVADWQENARLARIDKVSRDMVRRALRNARNGG